MNITALSKIRLDDSKEFEILDPLTGKTSQTYNAKTKKMEDTPAFISIYYAGSRKIKKFQLELQRNIVESIKEKKDPLTEKEIEELFLFELVAGYRGFKDDKGNELEYNESNTKLLLDIPYIRNLIEEASANMGNFLVK